jgi:glycosyltransferase involved in cell wall biosynthesis
MKKVIIITYYWPPMGGGGVQRWLKTTKYLREYGWEPIIFTTQNGEASVVDESALKQIPDGIEILKVPIWEPFSLYKKLTGKKKGEKLTPGTVSEKKASFTQKLSGWIRGNLFIPDARMFWIKPASKALNDYLKTNKIDAIVSSGPPHTTHMIALKVLEKNKIPWLADFRDPWTNIDFYAQLKLTNWADKKHKRLERAVLAKANQVITVSWSWAADFKRISGRMPMVITNGFDPEDFVDAGKLPLDQKFSIAHAGSLNDDRNPHSLWKALAILSKEIPDFNADLEIKFIGQVAAVALKDLSEAGLDRHLNLNTNLPHQEVVVELMKSQILLLPLNDTPNIDGVVPGKLYEYIGANRPIVCIGKPDGDAAKIMMATNAGCISDFNDVETLVEHIKSYYQAYKKGTLKVDSKDYEKYSRKLLAGQIAEELNKIAH